MVISASLLFSFNVNGQSSGPVKHKFLAPPNTKTQVLKISSAILDKDLVATYELSSKNDSKRERDPRYQESQEISAGKRLQEVVCVVTCIVLHLYAVVLLSAHIRLDASLLMVVITAVAASDFCSGLVHWMADTWGSVDMPIIGKNLLRPFRLHHIDPTSITRHGFIETNGDSCAITLPTLMGIVWKLATYDVNEIVQQLHWILFWYIMCVTSAMNNQIHKWSHTYFGLPSWVVFLQDWHLVLPRRHHRIHHISPHETHYCILTGWMNWPLEKIRFWARMEALVEAVTGCQPRSDDMKWARKYKN